MHRREYRRRPGRPRRRRLRNARRSPRPAVGVAGLAAEYGLHRAARLARSLKDARGSPTAPGCRSLSLANIKRLGRTASPSSDVLCGNPQSVRIRTIALTAEVATVRLSAVYRNLWAVPSPSLAPPRFRNLLLLRELVVLDSRV